MSFENELKQYKKVFEWMNQADEWIIGQFFCNDYLQMRLIIM